jgi:hypothetical protein
MKEIKFTVEMGILMFLNHLGGILLNIDFTKTILFDLGIIIIVILCIELKGNFVKGEKNDE